MNEIDWTECPQCGRTVPIIGGVYGVHIIPREARRWPKMAAECDRSGRAVPRPEIAPEPILPEM